MYVQFYESFQVTLYSCCAIIYYVVTWNMRENKQNKHNTVTSASCNAPVIDIFIQYKHPHGCSKKDSCFLFLIFSMTPASIALHLSIWLEQIIPILYIVVLATLQHIQKKKTYSFKKKRSSFSDFS